MKKYFLGVLIIVAIVFFINACKPKQPSVVGKWKSIDAENEYYYLFNQDKTCSYEMLVARLDCTYEIDGDNINILYNGNDTTSTFQYHFEENTLIIQDESGKSSKFVKAN